MELWQQIKYANIVSSQLKSFKIKNTSPFRANFRCIFCGDSQRNENKTRGYIVEYDSKLFYKCFNCSVSMSFDKFLSETFPDLHSEMIFEKYRNENEKSIFSGSIENKISRLNPTTKGLTKISSLSHTSKAKKYIEKRRIPANTHYRIFYINKFNKWINSIIPNKLNEEYDSARIVFPLFSANKKLKGVSARTLDKKNYLNIMFDENFPKVFGLDQVDFTKRFFVCESVMDSLFLPNSIALLGTESTFYDTLKKHKENCVIILDNQPRNSEVCSILKNKYISNDFNVFLWNSSIKEKDINELAINGYTQPQIEYLVNSNIYRGLYATLKFKEWCKINV